MTLQLPNLTSKQLQILFWLYKFRFLTTTQIQHLFNHVYPTQVQEWLKDLRQKQYVVYRGFNRHVFIENTKPAIYSLTKKARHKLKKMKGFDVLVLNRVYRESSLSIEFVNRYLFIVDLYLHLKSKVEVPESLHFSTEANLRKYEYFPSPLPIAYIALKSIHKTKRYFLYLLDEKAPRFAIRKFVNILVDYSEDNEWAEHTSDPLPSILLISPTEAGKKYILHYLSSKSPETPFYVSDKEKINKCGFMGDIWEKAGSF